MKEYLVWVNYGGENGCPERLQDYYKICNGNSEEEAVSDWAIKNEFNITDIRFDPYFAHHGRKISVIELIKSNGYDNWKTLSWI